MPVAESLRGVLRGTLVIVEHGAHQGGRRRVVIDGFQYGFAHETGHRRVQNGPRLADHPGVPGSAEFYYIKIAPREAVEVDQDFNRAFEFGSLQHGYMEGNRVNSLDGSE